MALPGLIAARNLADVQDAESAWDNLGSSVNVNFLSGIRSNVIPYSEDLTSGPWNQNRATISGNATIAPDGTLTADKIIEDTTTGSHYAVATSIGIAENTLVTISIFLKAAERSRAYLSLFDRKGAELKARVDLGAGTIEPTSSLGPNYLPAITSLPNNWYRVSLTGSVLYGTFSPRLYVFVLNDSGSSNYAGDGSSGLFAWGAQFEQGYLASSYIKTEASPVTGTEDNTITFNTVIKGKDILYLKGVSSTSTSDFVRLKGLSSLAQPRLTQAAANAASGSVLRDNALVKLSPTSNGNYYISNGILDGQSLRINGLQVASISGSPFSGDTALVPLSLSSFAAPLNLRMTEAMTSGALTAPERAIPIETSQFILYAKAGQS